MTFLVIHSDSHENDLGQDDDHQNGSGRQDFYIDDLEDNVNDPDDEHNNDVDSHKDDINDFFSMLLICLMLMLMMKAFQQKQ